MCGQHNVSASVEDNTGQNTDKGHTPNPRTEIKIPDSAGNRTLAAGLEGMDSTEHATATDRKLKNIFLVQPPFVPRLLNQIFSRKKELPEANIQYVTQSCSVQTNRATRKGIILNNFNN